MRIAPRTRRQLAATASVLLAAVLLASSCSYDAAVAVDGKGRIVGFHSLQVRSGVFDLALALALEGRELVLQLRWGSDPVESGIAL